MTPAQRDLAEELAAWLGPVLAEVGLVAASDDERVDELCDLLAAEARFRAAAVPVTDADRLLRQVRADRDELRDRLADAVNGARDEYHAACNAVARERDNAIHELALAEDELRTLRAHRCGLPASITEALNSGDGTYRP